MQKYVTFGLYLVLHLKVWTGASDSSFEIAFARLQSSVKDLGEQEQLTVICQGLCTCRSSGCHPYWESSCNTTPLLQPNPVCTSYSPSPPGSPGLFASIFSNCITSTGPLGTNPQQVRSSFTRKTAWLRSSGCCQGSAVTHNGISVSTQC